MLEKLRVVDLTHHLAGPFCTQKLADMGADVIKVEPVGGEWSRHAIMGQTVGGGSTAFSTVNRSKRGLAIDLKTPQGLSIVTELAHSADVFVVNMRPPAVKRLGLDYESLHVVNPRLVYAMISGFGGTGPLAGRPGQDLLIQAFTGVAWNSGRREDPPVPCGSPFVDVATSHLATIGILSALLERETTGTGQLVSVSMVDAAIDVQCTEVMGYLNNGVLPRRTPYWSGAPNGTAPYGLHPTKDGHIAIAFGPFDGLANALEMPELARYTAWEDGFVHRDEIFALVSPRLLERTTDEWIERLDENRVWCGRVQDYDELFNHPHLVENRAVEVIETVDGFELRHPRFPIRYSADQPRARRPAPAVGQHNDEVLRELGKSDVEIAELREAGVLR